jgi:histidine triad (HIT) family protein
MTAFVASHWWPANRGHALAIPNAHFENIYDFAPALGADLFAVSQRVAIAMKAAYECHGVSTRQHNEPAGYQNVWHFHQHVFPRWDDDRLYERHREKAPAGLAEIDRHAARLREHLG